MISPIRLSLHILPLFFFLMSVLAEDPVTEIKTEAHGLRPGAEDNTEALRAALAACAAAPNPRLTFAPGIYRFKTENFGSDKVLALIKDISNFSIEGNGAQILLTGDPSKVTGLRFSKCKNVRISNLSVDCEKLPFSQGKFISFDGTRLVIEMDPKFPLQEDMPVESIVDCDPETGLMLANIDLYHQAIESVQKEGSQLVVSVKLTMDPTNANRLADLKKLQDVLPGEKALIRQATYGSFMFTFLSCSNVTLEDVTVHCFAGMALHAQESSDITIRRFTAAPPKGSGRLLSITKDAIHLTHASGRVVMEDSHFDAVGDDAFNTYAKFRTLKKAVDAKNIEMIFPVAGWRGPTPEPGEFLNFWAFDTMEWRGKAEVEKATWDAASSSFKIAFRSALPEGLKEKDYISSDKFTPRVEVRRCTFRGMLARAIVFSTNNVLIEDCRINATSYSGILFTAGLRHGGQGPAPRGVVIRRNIFEGTGGAAIYGYIYTRKAVTSAMGDILIEDNQISSDPKLDARRLKSRRPDWLHWSSGLCLLHANNVRLQRNKFTGYPISLYLENIDGAAITENTSEQPTLGILNRGAGTITFDRNTNFTFERDQKKYDPELYYIGILR